MCISFCVKERERLSNSQNTTKNQIFDGFLCTIINQMHKNQHSKKIKPKQKLLGKKMKNEKASLQSKIMTFRRLKKTSRLRIEGIQENPFGCSRRQTNLKAQMHKKDFLSYVSFSCYIILVRFLQNLC